MALIRGSTDSFDEVHSAVIEREYVPFAGKLVNFDRYKMHICMSIDSPFFFTTAKKLQTMLDAEVEKGVIVAYKRMRAAIYLKPALTADGLRAKNSPYTLYLRNEPDKKNLKEVAVLCQKIENLLQNVPKDQTHMGEADLELTAHLVFRQTAFEKPEYIPAIDPRSKLLAEAGGKSMPFITLVEFLPTLLAEVKASEKKEGATAKLDKSTLLKEANLQYLTPEQLKKMIEFFLGCEDGRALLLSDYDGALNLVLACLQKFEPEPHFIRLAKDIIALRPDFHEDKAKNPEEKNQTLQLSPQVMFYLLEKKWFEPAAKLIFCGFIDVKQLSKFKEHPAIDGCVEALERFVEAINILDKNKALFKEISTELETPAHSQLLKFFQSPKHPRKFVEADDPIVVKLKSAEKILQLTELAVLVEDQVNRQRLKLIPDMYYLAKLLFVRSWISVALQYRQKQAQAQSSTNDTSDLKDVVVRKKN